MVEREIIIGGIYRHPDKFGTEYRVTGKRLWVDREEETDQIVEAVDYEQTKAGVYPVGTLYSRSVQDFLSTTIYDGQEVPKFVLIWKPEVESPAEHGVQE